ncbi:MAG: leucine-rich repeat protein [Ruminococcus sp.]|uniref:leucine-rich repeat protein n=1 Tax=Ruminococcus sp. TaxID=41978 RepID=UPI0025EF0CE1|nr:leucine-rich repeat protein [Ruminococcus sp.]MBR5683018.1 leucine-rich repeat protein [Ruminococcus sp.]
MITKRLFSILLSALFITCSVSDFNTYERNEVLAAEAEAISVNAGTCGDSAAYSLDDAGNLIISGSGTIYDYVDGKSPFANNDQIKKVSIEEGITHIGEYVFENCTSLTSIIIPDSVTSIGQYAFSGTAVKSVVIPESVVTLDSNSMFMDCKELESVVLPQSLTAIYSNAFRNCVKLKEVDIPDSVTAIQNDAFSGTTFTSLFIPLGVTMINGNALRGSKIDTIYGFKDSAAETFAKNNGLNFIESEERVWKRTDSLPVAGVYKLECDVDAKSYITISGMLDLDLNGHKVNIPEIICSSTSNVIIRDSDPQKKGTIICTEDNNLITSYNKLTIYGGNFYGYDKKTVCATVRINDGNFDFYGGEIIGYYSHALSVRTKDGVINIMGGIMKASSAENEKNNVYSVWLADTFAGTLNIKGGEIHSDLGAAVSGAPSDCIVNISGGKILSDNDYGFKCMTKGTVNLSGNICIKGEKGGIYVPNGKPVNITGAITGADVSVYAEASGLLTNGLGKYVNASTLKRYLPYIKANGTISVNNDGELSIDIPVAASTTAVSGSVTSTTTTAKPVTTTTTTAKPATTTTTTAKTTTATTTTAPTTTTTSAPDEITEEILRKRADVDGNGEIDYVDASKINRYTFDEDVNSTDYLLKDGKGDVNNDGIVDFRDSIYIMEYCAKFSVGMDLSDYFTKLTKLPKNIDKNVTISQKVASGYENDEYSTFEIEYSSDEPVRAVSGRLLFNGKPCYKVEEIIIIDKKTSYLTSGGEGKFVAYVTKNDSASGKIIFYCYGLKSGEYNISYEDLKFYGTDFAEYKGYIKKDFNPTLTIAASEVTTTTTASATTTTTTITAKPTTSTSTSTTTTATATTTTAPTTTSAPDEITEEILRKRADVNDDGEITSVDCTLVNKIFLRGNYNFPEDKGDVNNDGVVDFKDSNYILRYYAYYTMKKDVTDFFTNLTKLPKNIDKNVTISQKAASGYENDEYNVFELEFSSDEPVWAVTGQLLFNGKPWNQVGIDYMDIDIVDRKSSCDYFSENGKFYVSREKSDFTSGKIIFRCEGIDAGEYTISYENLKFYGKDFADYSGYVKKDMDPHFTIKETASVTKKNLGDIDGNKRIDAVDSSRIIAVYARLSTGGTATEEERIVCDVDRDGFIDAVDASKVSAYYAHVSTGGNLTFKEFLDK